MSYKKYLVISFGNYETKILVAYALNEDIKVLHTESINTKDCIINSKIENFEKLEQLLNNRLIYIYDNFGKDFENTIINLPIREFTPFYKKSEEYILKKELNEKIWKKHFDQFKLNNVASNLFFIDKKPLYWYLDEQKHMKPPFNIKGNRFLFEGQFYYAKNEIVEPFLKVLNDLNISKYDLVFDSLISVEAFDDNAWRNQLLINIGHNVVEITNYKNGALTKKDIIKIGIQNLTKEISNVLNILEEDSISILKDYHKSISLDENNITFGVIQENTIGKYKKVDSKYINVLINKWLSNLCLEISKSLNQIDINDEEVDDIYISSSLDFIPYWISLIESKLISQFNTKNKIKIKVFKNDIFGIDENKYNLLYYSLLYSIRKNIFYSVEK